MNRKSRGILITIFAAFMILCTAADVSVAYLVKQTETISNSFTVGDTVVEEGLHVELIEEEWNCLTPEQKVTYPGRTIPKDPLVKNTGDTVAAVFIEIKIPRANIQTVENERVLDADWHDLFTYTMDTEWEQLFSDTITDDGKFTVRVYGYTADLASGNSTTTLFDEVTFVNMLAGEIAKGTKLDIEVKCIAIAASDLDLVSGDRKAAMESAYDEYLDGTYELQGGEVSTVGTTNTFTVGGTEIEIVEEFTPPTELTPGTSFTKKPWVKNTGNLPCFVRVRVDFSSGVAEDFCELDINNAKWDYNAADGYYYYKDLLQPNEATPPLFTKVTISDDVEEEDLIDFEISIYAEAVGHTDHVGDCTEYMTVWD